MNIPNFLQSFFGSDDSLTNRFSTDFFSGLSSGNRFVTEIYGKKKAIWIDTSKTFKHYIEIPELRTVIDRKAKMISSALPVVINEKTKEVIENHWINDLINNPNPLQTWDEVIYSISVNDSLYSSSFCYCPERVLGVRNLLLPIASHLVQINTTGKSLKQIDKDGIIKNYIYNYSGDNQETLETNDVIIIQTTDGINILNPVSKIESLKFPLSNIKAQYNKRNILLENIGSIGILSTSNEDIGGALPMDAEEKKQIQRDWYNRSKDEVIITESNIKWTPMSYPTKDLMLFEELNADKIAIIDAYGLNSNMFSSDKGSTFSNVKYGERMAYNNTIIPEADKIYDNLSEQLGLVSEGLRIIPTFDHISVLQEDKLEQSESLNKRAEALKKIAEAGIVLSDDEKRAILYLNK